MAAGGPEAAASVEPGEQRPVRGLGQAVAVVAAAAAAAAAIQRARRPLPGATPPRPPSRGLRLSALKQATAYGRRAAVGPVGARGSAPFPEGWVPRRLTGLGRGAAAPEYAVRGRMAAPPVPRALSLLCASPGFNPSQEVCAGSVALVVEGFPWSREGRLILLLKGYSKGRECCGQHLDAVSTLTGKPSLDIRSESLF